MTSTPRSLCQGLDNVSGGVTKRASILEPRDGGECGIRTSHYWMAASDIRGKVDGVESTVRFVAGRLPTYDSRVGADSIKMPLGGNA